MSIAISLLSGSSRIENAIMALISTAFIAVGIFSLVQFSQNSVIITVCLTFVGIALALFNGRFLRNRDRSVRLTISASGQISLLRFKRNRFDAVNWADTVQAACGQSELIRSEIVQLLPDSTLWSFFILLRLRGSDKKITVLPIFSYSLSPQSFRRLSVACRWIFARNDAARADSLTNASPDTK